NATVVEQRAGTYQQRINRLLGRPRKGCINVTPSGGLEDFDLLPDGQGRSLNVRDKDCVGAKLGSTSTPTRTAPGCNSCNNPSCFAPSSAVTNATPVTLLPGRLRLATRPSLTGSAPLAKTIGIVVVAALATIDEGVSCAAITDT